MTMSHRKLPQKTVGLTLFLLLLVGCGGAQAKPTATPAPSEAKIVLRPGTIIVHNGVVIDGTGTAPIPRGLVAIRDGDIVFVGPEVEVQIPDDARMLDANGGTILPGFIDAHTHILANVGNMQSALPRWLRDGVTTIRDLGSRYGTGGLPSLSIANLKEYLAEAGNTIPTILIAGPLITAPGGYPIPVFGDHISAEVTDVAEAQQAARHLLADGADGLKIAVENGPIAQPWPKLTLEQVTAITEMAHEQRTRVSAHVTKAMDAQIAADGQVDDLAHLPLDNMSDELIEQLVNQDVYIVPTLRALNYNFRPRFNDEQWASISRMRQDNLLRFLEVEGKVALGSDYPNGNPAGMPVLEMELLQEAGMTPMQIIVSATRNAAIVCNLGDELGTLEVGKQADVIVVDGDPLQDIEVMKDVIIVIKGGEVIIQP